MFFSLFLFNISFSSYDCLKVKVVPLKDYVKINKNDSNSNYAEFNLIFQNNCDKDLNNLLVIYRDFVYYVYSEPSKFSLKKGESKEVDVKVYAPKYLSTGWKAIKLEVDKDNKPIKNIYLKFYLENPHYKVIEKVKYIYLKLIENLDMLIDVPPKIKCGLNKVYDFNITVKNLRLKDLKNSTFELVLFAKNVANNEELPLEWKYLNKINKSLITETKEGLKIKNKIYANFNVTPGFYTIEGILMIRQGKNYEVSEEAKTNIFVEGEPYFIVKKDVDKGLLSTKITYNITNIGNKKGVYELSIPVNWFKRLFLSYNFEAKMEDGKLIKDVELNPKESRTFTLVYDYSSIVIIILVLSVFGFIYYYMNYRKPFSFKKDVTKIHIGKNKKYFFIEVVIRNNSLKKMKDLVIIEKVQNGEIDELTVYPKPDRVKKDIAGSTVRWEVKELKPQQKITLTYKVIVDKNKIVISQPTVVKVNGNIYLGKGLKIYVGEELKFEEI